VKDLSKQIKETSAAGGTVGDELSGEFRKATIAAKKLGEEVRNTNKKIEVAATKSTGAMGKLGGSIVKHQNAIRNAGIIAGAAFALLMKSSITAASTLEESSSKIEAVFGAESVAIKQWAEGSAQAFGQSTSQALEAAGTYGNLFQAFGIGKSEAAEMSTSLVELAADLASFNNSTIEDTLVALRSGLSGETEPLKRFGIAINDVRLKEEAMRQGIYDGKGALTMQQKTMAAYELILKDTTLAQGDFERTSDGLANTQRITAAEFENAKAKLGEGLLPIVQKAVEFLGGLANIFAGMPTPIRYLTVGVTAFSIAVMIATPRIVALIASMKTAGITGAVMGTKLKGAARFIGGLGPALGIAGAAFAVWTISSANAKAAAENLASSFDEVTGAVTSMTKAKIAEEFLKNFSSDDLAKTPFTLKEIVDGVSEGGEAYEDLTDKFNDWSDASKKGLQGLNPLHTDWVNALGNSLRAANKDTVAAKEMAEATGLAGDAAGIAADDVNDLADAAEDAADAVDPLTNAMKRFGKVLDIQAATKNFNKSIKDFVKKPSQDAARDAASAFESAVGTFKEGSKSQARFVSENYTDMETTIKNSGLSKKAKAQLLTPLALAKAEADALLTSLKNIGLTNVSPTVNINKVSSPGMDPLRRASGGLVTGPGTSTSDSIPALLSNREYVLKASAVRSIGLSRLNELNTTGRMTDPQLLDRMAVEGSTVPLIGSITVNNPSRDVDVESAVTRAVARAERVKRERSASRG
jgi:hypothetical protein